MMRGKQGGSGRGVENAAPQRRDVMFRPEKKSIQGEAPHVRSSVRAQTGSHEREREVAGARKFAYPCEVVGAHNGWRVRFGWRSRSGWRTGRRRIRELFGPPRFCSILHGRSQNSSTLAFCFDQQIRKKNQIIGVKENVMRSSKMS